MDNEKLLKELLKQHMEEIPTFSEEAQAQIQQELEEAIRYAQETINRLEKNGPQEN